MIERYLLRYFLAVVDQGTFSRAATQCGVSQPTLSVGIGRLETLLNRPLFERSNRRVQLTAAGTRLAIHARRIEGEFGEAERSVRADPPARLIRIGIAPAQPALMIEAALDAALAGGHGERIEIVEGRLAELAPKLDRGRLDAVLGPLAAGVGEHALFTECYAMAMSATHPLATREQVTAEELAREPMIVRRHCEALSATSRFFTARGVRPFMAARTTNDSLALGYVRAGLGITVMPRSFAQEGIAMPRLAGFDLTRTIGLHVAPDGLGRLSDSAAFDSFRAAIARFGSDAVANI
jgi:DNA-binding transcriptional LysR family regulator